MKKYTLLAGLGGIAKMFCVSGIHLSAYSEAIDRAERKTALQKGEAVMTYANKINNSKGATSVNNIDPNRITCWLLAAVTALWLIPTPSLAGIPGKPKGLNIAAGSNPLDPPNCHDDLGNPSVYPPCSSYGEWTAKWWEWALSIPTVENPAFDPTGVNCGKGQAGPVWFMPPRFFTDPPIPFKNWTCTIPMGVSILLNASWNSVSGAGLGDCKSPGWGNPSPCDSADGTSVGDLSKANAAIVDSLVQSQGLKPVMIDSAPVQHPDHYRFPSPAFSYKLPVGNILSFLFGFPIPAGTYAPAVSDGYWLLIKPLSPGIHTLQTGGNTLTLIVQ